MFSPRFLIISLGNPAPYSETLHSAGHLALNSLQALLHDTQPRFTSDRHGKKSCLASVGPKYTMLQSPTLMNVSGPWVSKAWREILQAHTEQGLSPSDLSLILAHDDLEEELGVVKTRKWNASHRGHNGVKSVNGSLRHTDYKDSKLARISIGIGRPGERDKGTVSDYVLRPMTKFQKDAIQSQVGAGVLKCLEEMERQWEKDSQS